MVLVVVFTVVKYQQHVLHKLIEVVVCVTLDFVFHCTQVHGAFDDIQIIWTLRRERERERCAIITHVALCVALI